MPAETNRAMDSRGILPAVCPDWCCGAPCRCPQSWRLWMLYVIDVLYCRLCHHWRAKPPLPFLEASPAIIIANHRCVIIPD